MDNNFSITQTKTGLQKQRYESLVQEVIEGCKMAVINSRTALVDGYWAVGKAIREASPKGEITDLLHDVAVDSGVSERLLWYAVKAYDTYPDSVAIPEGNNITWHKLITKYLTTPEPEKDCNHEWIEVCKKCGKRK